MLLSTTHLIDNNGFALKMSFLVKVSVWPDLVPDAN